MREPFWGPNAKPLFVQAAVAGAVTLLLTAIGFDAFLYETASSFIGPVLRDSGICTYVTC